MTPQQMQDLNAHLICAAQACIRLPAEPPLPREQFRATLADAQRSLLAAECIVGEMDLNADTAAVFMQRVQLAATNLNTAVVAYRASWAST